MSSRFESISPVSVSTSKRHHVAGFRPELDADRAQLSHHVRVQIAGSLKSPPLKSSRNTGWRTDQVQWS